MAGSFTIRQCEEYSSSSCLKTFKSDSVTTLTKLIAAARAAEEKRIEEQKAAEPERAEREKGFEADMKQSAEKFKAIEQRAKQSYQNAAKGTLSARGTLAPTAEGSQLGRGSSSIVCPRGDRHFCPSCQKLWGRYDSAGKRVGS